MKKILIADDSSTMRLFVRMFMRNLSGVSLTEASDGFDALEKIKGESFDLIITDINMPRMDGLQLIENIRTLGLEIPIVILTTCGEDKDVETGLRLGANDYVTKPVTRHNFTNIIANYVDSAA